MHLYDIFRACYLAHLAINYIFFKKIVLCAIWIDEYLVRI